jgi:hypothetical protein
MERDWAGELEGYLRDRFAELCAASGQPVPFSGLRISPPLGLEEARYFLLGLEAGLFRLDELSYIRSELLPPPSEGETGPTACQLFGHDSPPRLSRERVSQLSTASLLILSRGWLRGQTFVEPTIKDDRSLDHRVDLLVRSSQGEILVCVEVKRSVAELQKLITDLRACCKRGPHRQDDCGFPQNHPIYEFCAFAKPPYFWAVAPDADVCLRMKYGNSSIELEQLPSLPPRSLIESN